MALWTIYKPYPSQREALHHHVRVMVVSAYNNIHRGVSTIEARHEANEDILSYVHKGFFSNDPQEKQIFTPSCAHWKALVLSYNMSQRSAPNSMF